MKKLTALTSRLPRISSPLPARECLGLEFIEGELRAALVRSRGRKQEIVDFVAIKVPDGGDDLPGIAQLREIAGRLNCKPGTKAVFATLMVRVVSLPMNRDRVKKMKRHLLTEAVKWEAESYTGVQAGQALAGVEVEKVRQEPGQVMEDMEEVFVQVSILEQNIFRALKERFRLAGLKLIRVYPSEVCFHVPLLSMHPESDRGVLDMGIESSGFALLKGGQTMSINTMNISTAMIREHLAGRKTADLEDTLRFNLKQAPAPLPVAVTGSGALDCRVLEFIKGLSPIRVEPLKLVRASGLTASGSEEGPIFASAAGAAIRELSGGRMAFIGITDAVPLSVKIKQSFYLVPIAAASFLFVLLLGHNLLMRYQEKSFDEQRVDIQAQIDERQDEIEQAKELRDRINEVDKKISGLQKQKEFLRQDHDQELSNITYFFENLARVLPPGVSLTSTTQEQGNSFLVAGKTFSRSGILEFIKILKEEKVVSSAELITVEEHPGPGRSTIFKFEVRLEAVPYGKKADQA